ncbi:MAG TPA: hypothetical protein VHT94_14895 [Streptosporangiaceae bacterium]|jgi:hypothetical protein|nr:hypothetical protein [Streptosporangiaceae bacterium]
MSPIVWIAIGIAAVVFLIFAAWPLYNTFRTRGQGADVREGQAYLEAKEEWQHAEAAHEEEEPPAAPGGGGPAGFGRGDTPLRSGTGADDEPGTARRTPGSGDERS